MADTKISALAAAGAAADANELVINEAGTSKKLTASQIKTYATNFSDHTHAVTGTGSTGGGASLAPTTLLVPQTAAATTEGNLGYDTTAHVQNYWDSQRARTDSIVGWCPFALSLGINPSSAWTTAVTLATGVVAAVPVWVPGQMLLQSVSIRELSATLARSWSWALYVQDLNNGNAGENSLRRIATSNAADTWTAAAASTRTSAATSAPVYIPAGMYWLCIRSDQGTQNISVGTVATNTLATNLAATKTTTLASPLDFVAVTWTKVTAGQFGVRLDGRVFGQTAAY